MTVSSLPLLLSVRPADRARDTRDALEAAGFAVLNFPVLDYVPRPIDVPSGDYAGVVITSVRAIPDVIPIWMQGIDCYVVGQASAQVLAERGGAGPVIVAPDIQRLVPMIAAGVQGAEGGVLYLRGDQVSADLPALLGAEGIQVIEAEVYRTEVVDQHDNEIICKIKSRDVQAVLLFSGLQAQRFVELIEAHGAQDAVRAISALCLSARVLEYARLLPWAQTYTATTPDLAGMVGLACRVLRS